MTVIQRTKQFQEWFLKETTKSQAQIESRLSNIRLHGHFGTYKVLGDVAELKWKSGRRVYFAKVDGEILLLLIGGNKNGQDKDIKKAKKILKDYVKED